MKSILLSSCILATSLSLPHLCAEDYKNPALPIETRVKSLVRQMTLEEKVKQLTQGVAGDNKNPNNQNPVVTNFDPLIGSVIFGTDNVYERNAYQKEVVTKSRLGIPLLFGDDVIHGYRTIFPSPLAQACSWNPELVRKSCEVAANEAKSAGIDWTFSPMIDVARDPRWGRVMEGYGEDAYATAVFAEAAVKGYQGDSIPWRVAACLKHYVGYGASEGGRDYAYTDISRQALWETYLPPYEAGVKAGARTLMSSFNDISGIPATANRYTLTDILRGKWGFTGFVVSDWASVAQLVAQGNAADHKEAAEKSINAGLDMDMVDSVYLNHLASLVEEKRVTQDTLDEAVSRVLRVKFELGLFENPYTNIEEREKRYLLPQYRQLAYQTAVESMVLLKNDKAVLPIKKEVKTIALIGPMVKDRNALMGPWSAKGKADEIVDIQDGVQKEFGETTQILYSKGCGVESGTDEELQHAVKTARQADIIVLCLGEARGMSGENASRATISLPPVQEKLAAELALLQKPTALLITSGRPVSLVRLEPLADAIIMTWQPGTEAGHSIAALLSGKENPSGRLAITMPRTEGQIPVYYNMRNRARPHQGKYQDISTDPMYWFGYGMSYTSYAYQDFELSSEEMTKEETLTVSVNVTNTGNMNGKETIFLYIQDVAASISQPLKRLIAFEKIDLKPGETKKVSFEVNPMRDLSFANPEGEKILEAGKFYFMIETHKKELLLK